MNLFKARQDGVALRQVQRCDDLPVLQPLVYAVLLADRIALQHDELLIEFLTQFTLPLERQVGGTHDQGPWKQTAQVQLAQQNAIAAVGNCATLNLKALDLNSA